MMTALSFLNSKKGSVLLEIAVAIAILAIVSGAMIRKNMIVNKAVKTQVTKSNIDIVVVALASFVANNKRLPRPASDMNGTEGQSGAISGYIPYKALGLSEKFAKDGYLQPLIYIAEPSLTENMRCIYDEDFLEDCFCKEVLNPSITVKDSTAIDIVAFAIDVKNHKNNVENCNKVLLVPTEHTVFFSRDIFLMKYLQHFSCFRERERSFSSRNVSDDENF
ncbi:MAG: hypothetical protein E7015_02975 [Alphaproteobacteria bacterium]|nr:hypothetical protein [Alphaproteobacteria bacterium]